MDIMKIILINIIVLLILGCTDESTSSTDTDKPSIINTMETNKIWPYKINGDLELVDCGFDGINNEIPGWCVGIIEAEMFHDYDEITIQTCGYKVFQKNNININNTKNVSVLIDKTEENYGERECEFSRVQIGIHTYKIVNIEYNK